MAKKKPASKKTKKKTKTKTTKKKPALKKKATVRKAGALTRGTSRKTKPSREKRSRTQTGAARKRSPVLTSLDTGTQSRRRSGTRAAGQSGDIQGLSGAAAADSESVEELLEEGQAFEAGVVSGVEDAESTQGEVRTKEVLEDDVPLEYLDKD